MVRSLEPSDSGVSLRRKISDGGFLCFRIANPGQQVVLVLTMCAMSLLCGK